MIDLKLPGALHHRGLITLPRHFYDCISQLPLLAFDES